MRIICCSPVLWLGPATVVEYDRKNGRLVRQFLHFACGFVSRREFHGPIFGPICSSSLAGGQTRWLCLPVRYHLAPLVLDLRPSPQRCHICTIKPCLALRTELRLAWGGVASKLN
jgi:hypothetical protein